MFVQKFLPTSVPLNMKNVAMIRFSLPTMILGYNLMTTMTSLCCFFCPFWYLYSHVLGCKFVILRLLNVKHIDMWKGVLQADASTFLYFQRICAEIPLQFFEEVACHPILSKPITQ